MKWKTLFVALLFVSVLTSCNKSQSCYDKNLYEQHKDDFCPDNCPGVIGCDGETYCNECYALRKGIRLQ